MPSYSPISAYQYDSDKEAEMVKINVEDVVIRRKTSNFVFWNKARIYVMMLS